MNFWRSVRLILTKDTFLSLCNINVCSRSARNEMWVEKIDHEGCRPGWDGITPGWQISTHMPSLTGWMSLRAR